MHTLLQSLMIILLLACQPLWAAPKADLWPVWQKSADQDGEQIDHSLWQGFLNRYLQLGRDGVTRMDYAGVSPSERKVLGRYLSMLQSREVTSMGRDQQRAYWINLYNAGTVWVILQHYPVDSIRDIDITPGWFSDGPWGKKLFKIEGKSVSLDDIEHRILRPIWQDARLHYALNCASIGCPNLQLRAFTAENSEQLLNQAAADFINHPRAAAVIDGELAVSSIYHWFKADFGGTDRGVIDHLLRFAKPKLSARLQKMDEVDDHHYDWSLNKVVEK